MVIFICKKCNKTFNKKSNYLVHINRKFSCVQEDLLIPINPINKEIKVAETLIEKNYNCLYCKKSFYNNANLMKHLRNNSCKVKKIQDNQKEIDYNENKKLNNELENYKKEINNLKEIIKEQNNKIDKIINLSTPVHERLFNIIADKNKQINQLKNPETKLQNIQIDNNKFTNEIKEKDDKIKTLEKYYKLKQKRTDYPDKNVIYILTTEQNKKDRIYIIGSSVDLKERLSTYNKTCEHEVVYNKSCNNKEEMLLIEKIVLTKLKPYKEVANRDRFVLPINQNIDFFTNIVNESIQFFNDEAVSDEINYISSEEKDKIIKENKINLQIKRNRGRPKKDALF